MGWHTNGCPIIKLPDVNGSRSCGSADCDVSGLEFSMGSNCTDSKDNSSKVRTCILITRFKWYLVNFKTAFRIPPKWGVAGRFKCHTIYNELYLLAAFHLMYF